MTHPYAFETDGRASLIPLAIWQTHFRSYGPDKEYELKLEPIMGAFVACVRMSDGASSNVPGEIRYGRTNDAGWIVRRELSALGEKDDMPWAPAIEESTPFFFLPGVKESNSWQKLGQGASKDLLYGLPNEAYAIYSSQCREQFDLFVKELKAKPSDAIVKWNVPIFVVRPQVLPNYEEVSQRLELVKDMHQRQVTLTLLVSDDHTGFYSGQYFQDSVTAAIFDATPGSLRALFRAELINWYAGAATLRSGPDLSVLTRARGMIECARKGTPDATFESTLVLNPKDPSSTPNGLFSGDTQSEERRVMDKYRIYAWQCAVNDVKKDMFVETLPTTMVDVLGPGIGWRVAAAKLKEQTGGKVIHPAYDGSITPTDLMLGGVGLRVVKSYFDLYTFGARLDRGEGDMVPLDTQFDRLAEPWNKLPDKIAEVCRSILGSDAPYARFVHDVTAAAREPEDLDELYTRYIDVAAIADHPWWDEPHKKGGSPAYWKHIAPSLKMIGESFKATSKTLAKLVSKRLSAHTIDFKAAHKLVQSVLRNEVAMSGGIVDPNFHFLVAADETKKTFFAHVDVSNGEITVSRQLLEDPSLRRTFQLIRKDIKSGRETYSLAKDLEKHFTAELAVPVDLADLKRHSTLPKTLNVLGESVNLVFAIGNLVASFQKDPSWGQVLLGWDVIKGVVAVADNSATVLNAIINPPIEAKVFLDKKPPQTDLERAGKVVGGIDGAVKLGKGCYTLFSEDGDVAYELRNGHSVRANVQRLKGVAQIVDGGFTVMAALPATSTLVGAPIILAVGIGGALISAGVSVYLDLTQEYEDHINDFEKSLDKARRKEIKDDTLRIMETVNKMLALVPATA